MATPLNRDNARYAINRAVRVRDRAGSRNGAMGRLIGVDGDIGLVRLNGHGNRLDRFPLASLQDDTTANGGELVVPATPAPAPKPVRVPEPTTIELKDQARAAARDELKSAVAEAELIDFGDFAAKVKAAAADVAAAQKMQREVAQRNKAEWEALEARHRDECADIMARHGYDETEAAAIVKEAQAALASLKSKANSLLNLFEGAST